MSPRAQLSRGYRATCRRQFTFNALELSKLFSSVVEPSDSKHELSKSTRNMYVALKTVMMNWCWGMGEGVTALNTGYSITWLIKSKD